MGARKQIFAKNLKKEREKRAFAKLNSFGMSPRKMNMVADLVRGTKVDYALNVLQFKNKKASEPLRKLLLSALANWENKNKGMNIDDANLYIDSLIVNKGRMLKRVQPAPQGRAHRIRKRFNHVYLSVKEKIEK